MFNTPRIRFIQGKLYRAIQPLIIFDLDSPAWREIGTIRPGQMFLLLEHYPPNPAKVLYNNVIGYCYLRAVENNLFEEVT